MLITNVSVEPYYRYIPLKGWDNVSAALQIYATGKTKGSNATQLRQVRDVNADPNLGEPALDLMAQFVQMNVSRGQFTSRMLAEAKQRVAANGSWREHYDYDAMGTVFFKTSVEIDLLDRQAEMYALGIYAAYVGDQPEEELAEYINVPRALVCSTVIVTTDPVAPNLFEFDFEQIVRRLDPVLNTQS